MLINQVNWLSKKYHGINWSSGKYDFKEKENLIQDSLQYASRIYMKGEGKIKWLREIIQDRQIQIINIEKIIHNNFRLKDETDFFVFKCYHHNAHKGICSSNNVFKIFQKMNNFAV